MHAHCLHCTTLNSNNAEEINIFKLQPEIEIHVKTVSEMKLLLKMNVSPRSRG